MLSGPLEAKPAVELQLAWDRIAGRHGDQLADARRYRGVASTRLLRRRRRRAASGSTTPSPPRSTPATPTRWRRLRSHVTEVSPGVCAFEMLKPSFCEICCELEHYEGEGFPVARPNSMNNYGVVLNSIGLERTMDAIQRRCVRPLIGALFPREGCHIDHHHSFMVQYRAGEDLGLDMHTDACDVTLNVCLGREFTGAGLTFCGLRGEANARPSANSSTDTPT